MSAAPERMSKPLRRRDTVDTAWFLDFDHTLFNTDEFFHVDVRDSLRHFGIDSASWERGYTQAWQAGYTLEGHAEEIYRQSGSQLALDEMRRILRDSFSNLERYIYPDVLPFLESAKRRRVGLYLLSVGDPEWQRYKVRGARIDHYFASMFFVPKEGGKANVILEQARGVQKVLMVDNNPGELDSIKDAAPLVRTYCINRVPHEMIVPGDELSRLKFLDAREYLEKRWRYQHVPCRTLDDIVES